MKDGQTKGVAQDVAEDLPRDVAQTWALGARAARALLATPPPPPPFLRSSRLGERGRYWAAQWHLARAVGKRFRGCRAKRLYVHILGFHKLQLPGPSIKT